MDIEDVGYFMTVNTLLPIHLKIIVLFTHFNFCCLQIQNVGTRKNAHQRKAAQMFPMRQIIFEGGKSKNPLAFAQRRETVRVSGVGVRQSVLQLK